MRCEQRMLKSFYRLNEPRHALHAWCGRGRNGIHNEAVDLLFLGVPKTPVSFSVVTLRDKRQGVNYLTSKHKIEEMNDLLFKPLG